MSHFNKNLLKWVSQTGLRGFVCGHGAGGWTQGLMNAVQALHHRAAPMYF
jgi:hypothetical protein